MRSSHRHALTLVEILVGIAILGILATMLMPAVQSSRESARRNACQNNLRQVGLAVLAHEQSLGRFPSNGWGWRWVGDADRGNGVEQPGGWIYNTLPYLEQQDVHDLGKGLSGDAKLAATVKMVGTRMPVFICPTRRGPEPLPFKAHTINFTAYPSAAKTDYAVNRGDLYIFGGYGPADDQDLGYRWPSLQRLTGISYTRSLVPARNITDGLSKTYLLGEKHLNARLYLTGNDSGDDASIYHGEDFDNARHTGNSGDVDGDDIPPVSDAAPVESVFEAMSFGGPHQALNMAFCDGSVHPISFEIDPVIHRRLGNREDGHSIENQDYQ